MRVLLLSLYFAPDVAANAVIMTELAEDLAARGHDVTVVTTFPHYAEHAIEARYWGRLYHRDAHEGVKIIRTYLYTNPDKGHFLARALSYVSFTVLSVFAALFSGTQDLVLAPSPPLTIGLSAYVASRLKRVPYVYGVQDVFPDAAMKLGVLRSPWTIRLARAVEQFVYRHAAHVAVLSEGFRAILVDRGVPPDKITVIPNFVDTDFIQPLPRGTGFRRSLALDDRFVVLYAGNVGHSQALEHVLESADLLRDREEIVFVIVGSGARRSDLEARAHRLHLRNIRFVPFQSRRDVPSVYAAADVALVTLKRGLAAASLPSKTYTIMASGRPAIAAVDRNSDIWRLVVAADCGLCVEPEDPAALAGAVRALHANPAERERLGRNGRAYVVQHYSRRAVVPRYIELMSAVAAQAQRRHGHG